MLQSGSVGGGRHKTHWGRAPDTWTPCTPRHAPRPPRPCLGCERISPVCVFAGHRLVRYYYLRSRLHTTIHPLHPRLTPLRRLRLLHSLCLLARSLISLHFTNSTLLHAVAYPPLHEYAGPTPPYPRRARARGLGPRPAQLPAVHAPGPARQDVAGRPVGARVGWVLRAATVGESSQPAQRRVHALLAALREAARHQYDPRRRRHAKRREGTVLVGDGVVSVGRCRRA